MRDEAEHMSDSGAVDLGLRRCRDAAGVSLEMRTACERCGASLELDGAATICSYECTFCVGCAQALMHVCPNCSGELVPRPRRVGQ